MYRSVLVLPGLFLLVIQVLTQQSPTCRTEAVTLRAIPVETTKRQNPVKP